MERRMTGFTLAELLAVLAVLAITLTLGMPAFAGLQRRARVASVHHLLTTSLAGARLAAVKLGQPVTICPSSDGRRCRNDLVWDDGWILYRDPGRDEQPASAATILQRVEAIAPSLALRGTAGRRRVRFHPSGWASGSNISLRLCARQRRVLLGKVIVNNAGRPRSERYPDADRPCPYAL